MKTKYKGKYKAIGDFKGYVKPAKYTFEDKRNISSSARDLELDSDADYELIMKMLKKLKRRPVPVSMKNISYKSYGQIYNLKYCKITISIMFYIFRQSKMETACFVQYCSRYNIKKGLLHQMSSDLKWPITLSKTVIFSTSISLLS